MTESDRAQYLGGIYHGETMEAITHTAYLDFTFDNALVNTFKIIPLCVWIQSA